MATEIRMPQLGLTMTEGMIGEWKKSEGEIVKKGETLLQIETDKLSNDIESEADGKILSIIAHEGDTVPVQGLLCIIGQPGEKIEAQSKPAEEKGLLSQAKEEEKPEPAATSSTPEKRIKISPLAKKTAKAMGVEYDGITGSGPGSRIVQQDILDYTGKNECQKTVEVSAAGKRVKLKGMRKVIAERMLKSHTEIPVVTQNMKIDVTELVKLREKANENRENRLSINDFILFAAAKALAANKQMLVSLDGDDVVYHDHVNIGMAVSTSEGLIVPVIRDADKMGLGSISKTAKDLTVRTRAGELDIDEYKGSTFTVSNLGMFGIETFTPIINQPEAAILGVCAIEDELALAGGIVTVRKKMRISLTYDHRLLDGAVAAQFQRALRELLENPLEMLLT